MRIGALPVVGSPEVNQLQKLEELQGNLVGGLSGVRPEDAMPEIGPGAAFRAEFANYLNKAVTQVEGKMRSAEVEKQKVLTGETNNLHQATIASSEAGIAFSLMIEVRNKLVESYQELMRMQV